MQSINTSEILSSNPFKTRILLAGVPASVNRTNGRHWGVRKKATDRWKLLVQCAVGYRKPNRPLNSFRLHIIRHSSNKLDRDNATASYKAIIDSLVSCGLIEDDRYSMMKALDVIQNYRPRKLGSITEIIVEEIM